jgi:hypothetical protein
MRKIKRFISQNNLAVFILIMFLGATSWSEFETIKLRDEPGITLSSGDTISNRSAGYIDMRNSIIRTKKIEPDSSTVVIVGPESNEYSQDSAGVEAAMTQAAVLVTSRGKRVSVLFKEGYYSLGYTHVALKDSVDLIFKNKCIFYSTDTAGTFSDDTAFVFSYWDGKPDIRNILGLEYRIVFGIDSSRVDGFFWKYVALVSQASTDAPTAVVGENSFGDTLTYTRDGTGDYNIEAPKNAFPEDRTYCVASLSGYGVGGTEALVFLYRADDQNLDMLVFDIAGDGVDVFTNAMIQIWVYPQVLANYISPLPPE